MPHSFAALSYRQKGNIAEISYLFVIGILSPLAVGLQNFSWFSYTLSYVLLTILSLPALVVFYRLYLPGTIGRRKYLLFLLLLPVYIALYELNDRLSMLALLHLPFIPAGYREGIRSAQPEQLLSPHFNENFGYTVLVLLAATSLYVIKILFKHRHDLSTLEHEKLRLELEQLKAQLQPHFFFNTINNMYALSVQHSPDTPRMINDLSGIMRYILYDARKERVPLEQEIDFIRSYINLENRRHTSKDIIDLTIQGDTGDMLIEPLLFLPIIENSFKHALNADVPEKWVRLVLAVDREELIFQAANSKAPGPGTQEPTAGGIGLSNICKRLELLYPRRHDLEILDEAHTFTTILTIIRHHD